MSAQSRYAEVPPAAQHAAGGGVPAGGLVAALWRNKLWIALPVIFASALAVLWLSSVTPLYRSTAKLLVENQETTYTRPSATVEERSLLDQEAIRSQVQLILSGDLSRHIITELGLARLPEFNPDSEPSLLSRILSMFAAERDPTTMTVDEAVLDRFYERLSVFQVENSRVIAIEFSSENPELAVRIANAIADGYIDMQKAAKRDATREASDWLRGQIETLRAKVDEAERRVEEYRTEHGLFSTLRGASQPQTLSEQQLGELTTQLALARAQKSEAEAKARLIREMLESGGPIESSEVLNSPLIQGLVTQQVNLRAQIAELSTTLGPLHPRMQQLNAQLGDLRRQIRDEAVKYARAAENDAAVAAEREQDLLASLDALKASAAQSNENEVELRALERDAKSERDLLESLLARYRDATARDDLESLPADARLISRAAPAAEPYFPKTLATLMAAFLGSLVLACGIVITVELLRSANEYPATFPVPQTTGETPAPQDARTAAPEPEPRKREPQIEAPVRAEEPIPTGYVADPLQTGLEGARGKILLSSSGDDSFVVLITTVRGLNDLTGLAMRLARDVAREGRRVVVVNTGFAEEQGEARQDSAGLAGLLTGDAAFEAVIERDKYSRVHAIAAGHTIADPLMLLASDRMQTVIEALRQTYDVVILVAPAVIRRGEARLLAGKVGHVVLLSHSPASEPSSRRARERLEAAGAPDVEFVRLDSGGTNPNQSAA